MVYLSLFSSKQCIIKQLLLLNSVFVISEIIKVLVSISAESKAEADNTYLKMTRDSSHNNIDYNLARTKSKVSIFRLLIT